jgi:class 3 adenylate cyclase
MPEISPSEELRAFVRRFYAAWGAQDLVALKEMFSTGAHATVIGTDPDEWWHGATGGEMIARQTAEMKGAEVTSHDLRAFACGNVGWASDRATVKLGVGIEVQCRFTMVFAIERGHWRMVQWHCSFGISNQDAIGRTLTTNIEAIERSIRDDRPDMRPASAPDGTVTILFTDMESSTVLLERLGDAEFLRLLAWHDRAIREVADEHRGFVVKSQGDGFMLAFPSAAFALRAALVMRERVAAGYNGLPVRIRAGLHAGEAIKHDDDFYGRTVVIAARISALALGGEILASDLVHALAKGLGTFTFAEPRDVTLKGLDGAFRVYAVAG